MSANKQHIKSMNIKSHSIPFPADVRARRHDDPHKDKEMFKRKTVDEHDHIIQDMSVNHLRTRTYSERRSWARHVNSKYLLLAVALLAAVNPDSATACNTAKSTQRAMTHVNGAEDLISVEDLVTISDSRFTVD